MVTGPRPTPHPIILHVDSNGNPVRLAEASAIYATNVSAVTVIASTVSASQWLGLESLGGYPGGTTNSVQYKNESGDFAGDSIFNYNPVSNRLTVPDLVVGNISSIELQVFNSSRGVNLSSIGLSSTHLSSTNATIVNISATTISAINVCAANYDSQFATLSFQNLDARYLNSSGESVTGSFYLQNLSSTNFSATKYVNLPSGAAIWNASALVGKPISSIEPGLNEVLVFNGFSWIPSAVAGVAGGSSPGGNPNTIQFRNGGVFSGVDSITYDKTLSALNSTRILSQSVCATIVSATTYYNLREGTAQWNANKIQDFDVLKTEPEEGDILVVAGSLDAWVTKSPTEYLDYLSPSLDARAWNAGSLRGYNVTSTPPVTNNVLVYSGTSWRPSPTIILTSVSSTNLSATNAIVSGLSATTYNLFGKDTSAASPTLAHNQTITYDVTGQKWKPGYTLFQATGAPSNLIGSNGDVFFQYNVSLASLVNNTSAIWNASAIKDSRVLTPTVSTGSVGFLYYNGTASEYQAIPFNTVGVIGDGSGTTEGRSVASFIGSSNDSFRINNLWANTVIPGNPDLPERNDVLVFDSDLYRLNELYSVPATKGWTWKQSSSLVLAHGNTGSFQIKGLDGNLSSIPAQYLSYDPVYQNTLMQGAYFQDGGSTNVNYLYVRNGGFLIGQFQAQTLSATNYVNLPAELGLAVSDETTDLATGTAKGTFRMPHAMRLTAVRANVNTAPQGANITLDIKKNGTSILTTTLSIDAAEKTSTTAATPAVIGTTSLADDDEITVDINQVGSGTAGKGLKIWLIGYRA